MFKILFRIQGNEIQREDATPFSGCEFISSRLYFFFPIPLDVPLHFAELCNVLSARTALPD